MSFGHRWERQMDHFVCHGPIPLEIGHSRVAADRNGDSSWRTKGSTMANASALGCSNSYLHVRYRVATKIAGDRLRGSADPAIQVFSGNSASLAGDKHIDPTARGHDRCRCAAGTSRKCERTAQKRNSRKRVDL